MKISLVNLPFQHLQSKVVPLGIAYLGAVLRKEGIEVQLIDANAEGLSNEEIVRRCSDSDIIGISVLTSVFEKAKELTRFIKEKSKKTVVWGGVHPTIDPESCLEHADVVFLGEAENTLVDFMKKYPDYDKVDGISFVKNGEIIKNRSDIPNINEIPFPARDLLPIKKYRTIATRGKVIGILTSRGCDGMCIFCTKVVFGGRIRGRTVDNVVDEIKQVVEEYEPDEIDFMDDSFAYDPERVKELCRRIISEGINVKWRASGGMRVDKLDKEMLELMKKAGCIEIGFGVESGDNEVLRKIGKNITKDQVRKAFRLTKKVGIATQAYFMIGFPFDTKETMEKTIDFALELDPDIAQFTVATPLRGTYMYHWAKKHGKGFDPERLVHFYGGEPAYYTENFSKQDIRDYYKRAYRRFYLRPSRIWANLKRINLKAIIEYLKMIL